MTAPTTLAPQEVGLLRLAGQRLAGERAATPVDAVRWLTAMQAQDFPGALASVALRTTRGTYDAARSALDAGEVVRSWPMRGTLHLVAAEDLPWMLGLLTPRIVSGTRTRRTGLGLDQPQLDRAGSLARDALSGGRRLRRKELFEVWRDGGIDPSGQRGVHVLSYLAMTGTLALGPTIGGEQAVVLLDEWVPHPRRPDRDEALGELALRYFRSHGPATVKDFTRWGHILVSDVKAGVALARPHLQAAVVDGVEHLMDPATPDLLAAARTDAGRVLLLPGFDEMVLGYSDRRAVIAEELADRIVPGGNGMFLRTVWADGRVVGTWSPPARASGTIDVVPLDATEPALLEAAAAAYAAWPVKAQPGKR